MDNKGKLNNTGAIDRQFYVQSDDIKLDVDKENSHTNLGFSVSDETDRNATGAHLATRL